MPSRSSGLGFPLFSSFCLVHSAAFSCKHFFGLDNYEEIHGRQPLWQPVRAQVVLLVINLASNGSLSAIK
jgi:ABC-type sugar transport system permease subunit